MEERSFSQDQNHSRRNTETPSSAAIGMASAANGNLADVCTLEGKNSKMIITIIKIQ